MAVSRYSIEFRPSAVKELAKIDSTHQQRIRGAIALLAQDPRPPAARSLRGRAGFRIRVGDYRVIYAIDDGRLIVVVITIGHRRHVYRT